MPHELRDGRLLLLDGEPLEADGVVALPAREGPRIPGLPADDGGFLHVDPHGRLEGVDHVFAAGDATSFPVKQGGLAAQQADAVAEAIAADLGALLAPAPFRPVLRGLLLTGGAPLYMRAELTTRGMPGRAQARELGSAGHVSARALWWPPGKIAGRYLAPFLATARPSALTDEPLIDRVAQPAPHAASEDAHALVLALAEQGRPPGRLPPGRARARRRRRARRWRAAGAVRREARRLGADRRAGDPRGRHMRYRRSACTDPR